MTYADYPFSTVLTDLSFFQTGEAVTSNFKSETKLTAVNKISLQSSLSDEMCGSVVSFWFGFCLIPDNPPLFGFHFALLEMAVYSVYLAFD